MSIVRMKRARPYLCLLSGDGANGNFPPISEQKQVEVLFLGAHGHKKLDLASVKPGRLIQLIFKFLLGFSDDPTAIRENGLALWKTE